ncbi:hypothetical protein QE364_000592 [Nocardioides zeae]|uniref:Uncharacterized protein n=1 Tax=Nocardioides zeae TaxID=1457234 RepID=A0ACC6IE25_9ACTN|nr:type IV toxin-antitoxin system AbiEi family antitoxin [Nocardioides zeae]MDR6174093.1 hypothetical protein [Nocardioides zeae]MDR6208900.1 hypothetical protein [Nocardioides zeae]
MAIDAGDQIVEVVRERLAELGLQSRFTQDRTGSQDGVIELTTGRSSQEFDLEVKHSMSLTTVAGDRLADRDGHTRPALVVGARIHERSARAFRDLGIAYADMLGNASIRFDNVLVDVRGRRPDGSEPRALPTADDRHLGADPGPSPRNLFSSKRSMVIASILTWPHLLHEPTKSLAQAAGVSLGLAHETVHALEMAGYLVGRRLRLDRAGELLHLWAAAYPAGLGVKLAIVSYTSDRGSVDIAPADIEWPDQYPIVLSGESIPDLGLGRPSKHTLYIPEWHPTVAARNRWRPARTSNEADIRIRHQFWTTPGPLPQGRSTTAPWPIVYADLMAENDPRLLEAATEWRARHARLP